MSFLSFEDRPALTSILCALLVAALIGLVGYFTGNWVAAVISVLSVVLVILVVVMVRSVFQKEKKSRLGRGLEDRQQQAKQSASHTRSTSSADVAARFREALSEIRRSLGGRASVYELPWYLVMGPEDSGKSAMLLESGLELPAQYASSRVFGPTQSCEILLFNEAVGIDTAGRYFSSDSERDRDDWHQLLQQMRSSRPDCPANGLIFVISIERLRAMSTDQLEEQGRELRRRLNEVHLTLGLDAPIYIVLTKADQIEGFAETVRGLTPERLNEAFGWTNDQRRVADPEARAIDAFVGMSERVDAFSHELLMRSPDPISRRRIFTFPQELEEIGEAVACFVGSAFKRDIYNAAPFLRGIYLTSSRIEGEAKSRTLERLGHDGWATAVQGAGAPQGYFLRELFREIILLDHELAVLDNRVAPMSRRAMMIGGGVISLCLLALWSVSFWQNYRGTHALEKAAKLVLSADPTIQQVDAFRVEIDALDRGDFINTVGFGVLAREVERAKLSFVHAFDRNFAQATRDNLSQVLRRRDDDAFGAAVALGTDLEWLSSTQPGGADPPDFIPHMPRRVRDGEGFLKAYSAYTRWLPDRMRSDLLQSQRDLLARDAKRLLNLGGLEAQTRTGEGKFGPVDYGRLGFEEGDIGELANVPGIYTEAGFEGLFGYLLSAVESTASISSQELASLRRNYVDRHDRAWRRFLLDVPGAVMPTSDVRKSPYLVLLEKVSLNASFELPRAGKVPDWIEALAEIRRSEPTPEEVAASEDEEGNPPPPPPWKRYMQALESVAIDVEGAVEDSAQALLVARDVATGKPSTFGDALAVAKAIVPRLGDTATRNKIREILEGPILDGFSAVLLAARSEIDIHWKERISSRYGANISQSEVEALYSPDSGELDAFLNEQVVDFYKNGVAKKLIGGRSMPLGSGFRAWLASAGQLKRSLFAGQGGSPRVSVRLKGVPSTIEGVSDFRVTRRDLRLVCPDGEQTFIYREGGGTSTFNWGSRCQEVSLRVQLGGAGQADQQVRREWMGPLAMPQFLRDGRKVGSGDLQWNFETPDGADVLVKYNLVSGQDVRDIAHRRPPGSLGE
jgi:hypothetical protein